MSASNRAARALKAKSWWWRPLTTRADTMDHGSRIKRSRTKTSKQPIKDVGVIGAAALALLWGKFFPRDVNYRAADGKLAGAYN
jgi:hypothetical protein